MNTDAFIQKAHKITGKAAINTVCQYVLYKQEIFVKGLKAGDLPQIFTNTQ